MFLFKFQVILQAGSPHIESNPTANVRHFIAAGWLIIMPSNFQTFFQVNFTINQMAVSGIKVSRLDMYGEKYRPFKGVKYITKAGRFQFRL